MASRCKNMEVDEVVVSSRRFFGRLRERSTGVGGKNISWASIELLVYVMVWHGMLREG